MGHTSVELHLPIFFEALLIKLRDTADVPDKVRGRLTIGIGADGSSFDSHTRQGLDSDCHLGDLLVGELGLKGDGVELSSTCQFSFEAPNISRCEVDQGREGLDERVHIDRRAGFEFNREASNVSGKDLAIAVENQPARGLHGKQCNAVVFCLCCVVLVLPDLQRGQSKAKQTDTDRNRDGRDGDPSSKVRGCAGLGDHARSRSWGASPDVGRACALGWSRGFGGRQASPGYWRLTGPQPSLTGCPLCQPLDEGADEQGSQEEGQEVQRLSRHAEPHEPAVK